MPNLLNPSSTSATDLQNSVITRQVTQLSEGTVSIDRTIFLGDGATLKGADGLTTFKRAPGFKGNLFDTKPGVKDVQLLNCTIDDDPDANSLWASNVGSMAVHFNGVNGGLISGVTVKNTYRWGIFVSDGESVLVDHCSVFDARGVPLIVDNFGRGGHGIVLQRGFRHRVSNCRMERCWRTGFYAIGSIGWTIDNCVFHDNAPTPESTSQITGVTGPGAGIERGGQLAAAASCQNFTISNNILTTPANSPGGSQGIEIDISHNPSQQEQLVTSTRQFTIIGNQVSGQNYPGIILYAAPSTPAEMRVCHAKIVGNTLINNNRLGNSWYGAIHATTGLTDFSIVDNTIIDDAPYAPGIRAFDPIHPDVGASGNYRIAGNAITLTNQKWNAWRVTAAPSMSWAIDHKLAAGYVNDVGPNKCVRVNGVYV